MWLYCKYFFGSLIFALTARTLSGSRLNGSIWFVKYTIIKVLDFTRGKASWLPLVCQVTIIFWIVQHYPKYCTCTVQGKYLDCIDKFLRRPFRFGYTCNLYSISEVIRNRDRKLWNIVTVINFQVLNELLPRKRQRLLCDRGHNFILATIKMERYNKRKRETQME